MNSYDEPYRENSAAVMKRRAAIDILRLIDDSDEIAVCAHTTPDGDAVAASLTVGMCLKKMGKKAYIFLEEYNKRFDVIPGKELIYKGSPEDITVDTVIVLDCGRAERVGAGCETLLKRAKRVINIDHHVDNTRFGDWNFIDSAASSTSQLVFEIFNFLVPVDKDIASAVYGGIVFDTGGFRHGITTAETYRLAASLLEFKIGFNNIYNEILYRRSEEEAKIFGRAISNMKIVKPQGIAYTALTSADMEECGATVADLEGIAEFLINIKGTKVAILISQRGNEQVKASLRSRTILVNKVCGRFGGGGHKSAAGCTINATMEKAVEQIINEVIKELSANE